MSEGMIEKRLDAIEAKLDEVLTLLRTRPERIPMSACTGDGRKVTIWAEPRVEKPPARPFRCAVVGCTLGVPHDHDRTMIRWRTATNATWQPHPEDAPADCAPVWRMPINDPNGGRR